MTSKQRTNLLKNWFDDYEKSSKLWNQITKTRYRLFSKSVPTELATTLNENELSLIDGVLSQQSFHSRILNLGFLFYSVFIILFLFIFI